MKTWVDDYFREAPEAMKTWIAQTRQSTQSALKRIADVFLCRWGGDGTAALRRLRRKSPPKQETLERGIRRRL